MGYTCWCQQGHHTWTYIFTHTSHRTNISPCLHSCMHCVVPINILLHKITFLEYTIHRWNRANVENHIPIFLYFWFWFSTTKTFSTGGTDGSCRCVSAHDSHNNRMRIMHTASVIAFFVSMLKIKGRSLPGPKAVKLQLCAITLRHLSEEAVNSSNWTVVNLVCLPSPITHRY